jgi:hypothetical protein
MANFIWASSKLRAQAIGGWSLGQESGSLDEAIQGRLMRLLESRLPSLESDSRDQADELAIRSALGAKHCSAERSLLAESLVLCGSGALAAVALAIPMVAVLGCYASRFSVRANDLTLDFSLVWFGIGLALIASVFLAFIPRLPSANAPQRGHTGRGTGVAGGTSRRLRIFAVTQIAASFLLLAGACVLMKTLFVEVSMTHLRRRMQEDLRLRNFSERRLLRLQMLFVRSRFGRSLGVTKNACSRDR